MPPLPSIDLRAAILDAARARFAEEGVSAVSMRRIAADAGCSATAIYLYFKDREALIEALSLEDFLLLARKLSPLAKVPDPLERLRRMAEAYGRFALEKPHAYQFLFMTQKAAVPEAAGRQRNRPEENAYLMLRGTIQQALERKQLKAEDPDLLGQTLLAGVHGVVALHLTNFEDPWVPWRPVKRRIRFMADALLASFTA